MENTEIDFNTISIIGIGMMGASVALALKKNNICKQIIAYDVNKNNLKMAKDLSIIDEAYSDLAQTITLSDLIIICSPLTTYNGIFKIIKNHLKENAIITDIGSVKMPAIVSALTILNEDQTGRFVAAHPIAGTEKSGSEHGRADIFENKNLIITPINNTQNEKIVQQIQTIWEKLGSHVEYINPKKHDFIYASVSHNIQLLCSCFSVMFEKHLNNLRDDIDDIFLKFIRLSGSNLIMWRDIFLHNSKYIDLSISIFIMNLSILESIIENNEEKNLKDLLELSSEKRKHFHAISNPNNNFSTNVDHYQKLTGKSKVWIHIMPRLIACITMECISENEYSYATGAGINDFSRNILLDNATETLDILENKKEVLAIVNDYKDILNQSRTALINQDKDYLEKIMQTGNNVYNAVCIKQST